MLCSHFMLATGDGELKQDFPPHHSLSQVWTQPSPQHIKTLVFNTLDWGLELSRGMRTENSTRWPCPWSPSLVMHHHRKPLLDLPLSPASLRDIKGPLFSFIQIRILVSIFSYLNSASLWYSLYLISQETLNSIYNAIASPKRTCFIMQRSSVLLGSSVPPLLCQKPTAGP